MCRKKQLHGWCAVCFGFGLMVGHWVDAWFYCGFGGLALVILGFTMMSKR